MIGLNHSVGGRRKMHPPALLFSFFFQAVYSSSSVTDPVLPHVWNELAQEYMDRESGKATCHGCNLVQQYLDQQVTELNLTQVKIEMVKSQILKALGLSAPPRPLKRNLPHPISEGSVFKVSPGTPPPDSPVFTTTAGRVAVIPTEMSCRLEPGGLVLNMKYETPEALLQDRVTGANLWLSSVGRLSPNQTSIPVTVRSCYEQEEAVTRLSTVHSQSGGWYETNVLWMLGTVKKCYDIQVSLPEPERTEAFNCSLYNSSSNKPFILAEVSKYGPDDEWRGKRNVNCADGITECCREKLYLSFAEIGWADWIIQPRGYDAYFCKGTCDGAASISLGATPYHSVIKKLYSAPGGNTMHIIPCCTPTRLSPVELIYMDQNGTMVQKTIPNLTVQSCGCM